jgi:hypothetical protein
MSGDLTGSPKSGQGAYPRTPCSHIVFLEKILAVRRFDDVGFVDRFDLS